MSRHVGPHRGQHQRCRLCGTSPRQLGSNERALRAARSPADDRSAPTVPAALRRAIWAPLGADGCPLCLGSGWEPVGSAVRECQCRRPPGGRRTEVQAISTMASSPRAAAPGVAPELPTGAALVIGPSSDPAGRPGRLATGGQWPP